MIWNGNISIAIKEAGELWSLSNIERGMLGTVYTLGLLFGSYVWGHIGNSKGRLRSLYFDHIGSIVSALGYTVSVSYSMLMFFALCVGFFMGGVYVLSGALYSESSAKSKEWTLVLLSACIALGGVIVYLLALVIVLATGSEYEVWRYVGACSCLIEGLCFGLLFLVYESPKFVLSMNDVEKAKGILK